jgi:transcriptional regulator with XRE-family HTH domain
MPTLTSEPDLISQAEFARRLGVSRQYIGRLVKKGKLELVGRKLDADASMAVLEGLADPARPRKTSLAASPPSREIVAEQPEPADDPEGAIIKGEKRAPTFAEAKTMKEVYLAKMARLKYQEEAGRFLEKAEVERRAQNVGMVVRQNLLSLPSRLMDQLAFESDPREINALLEAEVREVLTMLAEELMNG